MNEKSDYGMIGLGTMGSNLVLNMVDHGYTVCGYDKDIKKIDALVKEAGNGKVTGATMLPEFIASLKKPRIILMLVPAGPIVDAVIDELQPLLSENDLIMDWGNSHFSDTNARIDKLALKGIEFMGVGVSGGDSGARFGPSIMPGGDAAIYKSVAPMLRDVSAKVNDEACVTWIGNRSAGHYVKMIHNGIEYGLMQLIAEAYHMMKEICGLGNDELHKVFSGWNEGPLKSFLFEITAGIFIEQDSLTPNRIIDMILDSAHQKGTGAWTSQDALELQLPVPSIDTAVSMRELSGLKSERIAASKILSGPERIQIKNINVFINELKDAMQFAITVIYAQGFALMQQASLSYKYEIRLNEIAKIWRGGCIIRSALLDEITEAFEKTPAPANLMLDSLMAEKLNTLQYPARKIICAAIENGIPVACFSSALSYFDSYRRSWLPANLIQAQRDFFGAHTYERTDEEGSFHTLWNQK